MSEEQAKINEDLKAQLEERRIQMEAVQKEYSKLPKTDKKFIGIDLESKEYWIFGHGWSIATLGFNAKKKANEMFSAHDALVVEHDEADPVEDASKRVELVTKMLQKRDEIVEECIPIMLRELDGKSFDTKWFDTDEIPADSWWTCVTDVLLFLRGRGSREDILLSMMQSGTVSQTGLSTSKTQKKST